MMNILRLKIPAIATTLFAALLIAEPAEAFRCGNKLIKDGMHEAQVVAKCGQPTTVRDLGVAVRGYDYVYGRHLGPGWTEYTRPGLGGFVQEVVITEYVYNFGPRKLMRRLLFEGGVLVTIETLGYGYRE
jgi:hypothetical protein